MCIRDSHRSVRLAQRQAVDPQADAEERDVRDGGDLVLVLITHNLAVGVVGGVLVASVLFVRRVAHFVSVSRTLSDAGDAVTYTVTGELFFASSNDLTTLFSYPEDPDRVVIDLAGSHIWDASTVAALDAIETKYTALGKTVEIIGMNDSSQRMRGRLTGGFE